MGKLLNTDFFSLGRVVYNPHIGLAWWGGAPPEEIPLGDPRASMAGQSPHPVREVVLLN